MPIFLKVTQTPDTCVTPLGHWAAENEIERFFFSLGHGRREEKEVPPWCAHGLSHGMGIFLCSARSTCQYNYDWPDVSQNADHEACTWCGAILLNVWEPKLIVLNEIGLRYHAQTSAYLKCYLFCRRIDLQRFWITLRLYREFELTKCHKTKFYF